MASLSSHRKDLFVEVSVWHVNSSIQEMARNATGRDDFIQYQNRSIADMEYAAKERTLANEERKLFELERTQASEAREQTRASLLGIQEALRDLETKYMGRYSEIVGIEA